MFMNGMRTGLGFFRGSTLLLLGISLTTLFPTPSMAGKIYWWVSQSSENPNHIEVVSEEDGVFYLEFWDLEYEQNSFVIFEIGTPADDGQPTGLGPDQDTINKLKDRLKKLGADLEGEVDPRKTPLGRHLVERGKLPGHVTDPWEFGSLRPSDSFDGQGGFDPNVPLWDQIKKRKGNGGSEDDDDGRNNRGLPPTPTEDGGAAADLDLVNPVPIRKSWRPSQATRPAVSVRTSRSTRASRAPMSVRSSRSSGVSRGSMSVVRRSPLGVSRGSMSFRGMSPAGVSRVSPSSARRR